LEAYILIEAESGKIWDVTSASMKIKGIKKSQAVAGQYDAVAVVNFKDMDDLSEVIEKVQKLKGVSRTQTLIAIPSTIRR
jgi:DNA-binding Lrp family transcriptional regulator